MDPASITAAAIAGICLILSVAILNVLQTLCERVDGQGKDVRQLHVCVRDHEILKDDAAFADSPMTRSELADEVYAAIRDQDVSRDHARLAVAAVADLFQRLTPSERVALARTLAKS